MRPQARLAWVVLFTTILSSFAYASDESIRNRIKIRKKVKLERQVADMSEEFNLAKMEVLSRKRQGLIQDIKRFLTEGSDSAQRAELNLRLGGLYLEDYYAQLAKAQKRFEDDQKVWDARPQKAKGKRPVLDDSEAIASLERARVLYKDLVVRYPNHSRRDEMLYFLALTSLDRGLIPEAMGYFEQLARETPKSKYVAEALIQLGDHHFEHNRYKEAENNYDQLIAKKYPPLLPYATYKKAWCAYNTGRIEQALSLLKWVITAEDDSDSPQVRVKAEALKDIALPFADLKRVEEAIAFFKPFGQPQYRNGVTTIAQIFFEQGHHNEAIQMFEHALSLDPNHPKNPSYDINVIESLMNSNHRDSAVNRLFNRLPIYLGNSTWYELNSSNAKVIAEAQESFEATARKYAFQIHAEAQKSKQKELYTLAKLLYSKYLQFFPRTVHAPTVQFYLAEIHYKQDEFLDAAKHYYAVYKEPAAGKLRLDAIRYALNALDRQLNLDRKKAGLVTINNKATEKLKAKEDEDLKVRPYTTVENQFLEIGDEYIRAFPKQKDAPDVLYEQSYLRYDHHELVPAYKSFWSLVTLFPKHETAKPSAYLILDILNRKKDYPRLILACKRFLKMPEFNANKSFMAEIADILRRAELKRIQTIEEKGQFADAGNEYIEYTKAYGSQDEALFEKALYNAQVNYTKADLVLKALEVQERFLRRFPKSPLNESMLLQVATAYESLALFDKAASSFESFFQTFPHNKQSRNALRLAGLYYWGAGNPQKAETTMLAYLRAFPQDGKQVERDLLALYESEQAVDRQIRFYSGQKATRGVSISDAFYYTMKIGELHGMKHGRLPSSVMQEALKMAHNREKQIASVPRGAEAMSKLWFWQLQEKDSYFRNLKLALPQAQLEANLTKKLKLLKELERDYSHIASLGNPDWGLASMFRTAEAYRHMSRAVLSAPVPAQLTGEQLEIYRTEINKSFITPFNEKALGLVEQCLDKGTELNLLSAWIPRCYSLAAELKPDRYPPARTLTILPVRTALLIPEKGNSKLGLGDLKLYAYPFYSSHYFRPDGDRQIAANVPALYGAVDSEGTTLVPVLTSYKLLGEERDEILRGALKGERVPGLKNDPTMNYLNLIRLLTPKQAVPYIRDTLAKDPKNDAIHNILALAQLEAGNLTAAKVTWLSMVARGAKNAAIWNNLGVVAYLEGNEAQAIEYFQEACLMPRPREALSNLGFIALRYRNGFEGKKHFQKVLEFDSDDALSQVGQAVGVVQNREWELARKYLIEVVQRYKSDPYARLSLGYYLIDVEKEGALALRALTEYTDARVAAETDVGFRKVLQEARSLSGRTVGDLPEVED